MTALLTDAAPATLRPTPVRLVAVPAGPRLCRNAYEPDPSPSGRGEAPHPFPHPASGLPDLPARPPEQAGALEAVGRVLRLTCEVLDGRRPARHMAAHTDVSVVRYWRFVVEQRLRARPGRRSCARLASPPRLCHPRDGVAEVSAVLEVDGRMRALATRFERASGRWSCVTARLV